MNTNKPGHQKQTSKEGKKRKLLDARLKYFIQAIDIKQDTNMTRIYSALQQSRTRHPANSPYQFRGIIPMTHILKRAFYHLSMIFIAVLLCFNRK